jgi:hypothetical protein
MATERGFEAPPKSAAVAKVTGLHVTGGVVTVSVNVFVVATPTLFKPVTVTV